MFTAANPNVYRFCTDSLHPRDRQAIWREEFGRPEARLEFEPLGDYPCRCEAAMLSLPDLVMGTVAISAASVARTPELIATETNDDIILCLGASGTMLVSGRGREVDLSDGDAVLLSYTETCEARFPGTGANYIGLQIPRRVIASRVPAVMDRVMRPIPQRNEALQLLHHYIQTLKNSAPPSCPAVQRALVSYIHDLVAVAIGNRSRSAEQDGERGVGVARLAAIKNYVSANIHRSNLSVADVAAHHRITPRYLHKLFQGQDRSFSRYVLDLRLDRAMVLLKDPRYAGQTVTAIAHEAGFNDLSYFNRCFRNRYQTTPSCVRMIL